MRALFLLLVLANIGFFAWSRYWAPPEANADPAPLGRQIDPDKLKILGPGEPPAALLNRKPPATAPALAAAPPAPVPAAAPAAIPAAAPAGACMEWGSFTLADAPKAEKALEPLAAAIGAKLAQRRTEETAGWWVFIPSQGSRPGAVKKAAELKARGVQDYFIVVDEGPFRWGVSLGVFRNEDAAQARLAALRLQGVRSAQVGPRETVVPKVWLQLRGVDPLTENRLKEIARSIDGSELRNCP
jgi:hypothetical protein